MKILVFFIQSQNIPNLDYKGQTLIFTKLFYMLLLQIVAKKYTSQPLQTTINL